jgi:hypothetical protein
MQVNVTSVGVFIICSIWQVMYILSYKTKCKIKKLNKNKLNDTVGTVPKLNRTVVKRDTMNTAMIHIHDY